MENVLLKEKAAELKAKLGSVGEMLGGAGALFAGGGDGATAQTPWQRAGVPMLAAYAVFFLCSLLFGFASLKSHGVSRTLGSMWGLGDGVLPLGATEVFLLLAWASVAVPMFVKHRLAPLASVLPLLVVLGTVIHVSSTVSGYSAAGIAYGLQFGFYACLLASAFAAFCGVRQLIKI